MLREGRGRDSGRGGGRGRGGGQGRGRGGGRGGGGGGGGGGERRVDELAKARQEVAALKRQLGQ